MNQEWTFEQSFQRLEKILAKVNEEELELELSLKLYEEAEHLLSSCQNKLKEAEQRIDLLVKKRKTSPEEAASFTKESFPKSSSSL